MSDIVPFGEKGPTPVPYGPNGGGPHPAYEVLPEEETIDLREVLGVLRRNAALIAVVTAVVLGVAAFLVLRQEPVYRASGLLRLLDERGAVAGALAGGAVDQVMGKTADPVLSQLQVLESRGVLTQVVERTGLRIRPETHGFPRSALGDVQVPERSLRDTVEVRFGDDGYRARSGATETQAPYGRGVELPGVGFTVAERPEGLEEATFVVQGLPETVNRLREDLQASVRDRTDVIDLAYSSTDPELAQRVVNTVAEVFQETSARTAQQQARRRRIFVEEQLAQTDSALQRAQLALTNFQTREAVFSSQERAAAAQEGLMQLEMRREELAADRATLASLLGTLRETPDSRRLWSLVSTPSVAQNGVVVGLADQMVKLVAKRDSLTSGAWGSAASNPDVERLDLMLASTRAQLLEAVRSHAGALDARIAALDALRARNVAEMQTMPATGAEEVWLVQRLETVRQMADQLRGEYQRARIAEAVEAGQVEVIDFAVLPVEPIGSGKGLKLALALMLGLMLGSGAAFVKEHLNTSIQRTDDLEALRVPSLAVIPRIASSGMKDRRLALSFGGSHNGNGNGGPAANGGRPELVTVHDLRSPGSEAYRTLRTNLIFSQAVQTMKTVVVTSSAPSEGKTTTAANLAVTFAQQGMRVLIVDCDLRKGRLQGVFNVPREPGLTQLVLGHADVSATIHDTEVPGLSVLPSGTLPPNPAEFLGGEGMRQALERLNDSFDMVILDTAPLLAAADAAVLGRVADGVLLVVRAGQTDRAAAQQALHQLHTVGARVLGAVLNDPESKVPGYGGYYYYSYYGAEA